MTGRRAHSWEEAVALGTETSCSILGVSMDPSFPHVPSVTRPSTSAASKSHPTSSTPHPGPDRPLRHGHGSRFHS